MPFWDNVLQHLEARQLSLRTLAKDIGLTSSALSKYARGTTPGLDVAVRISQVLGVSLDELVAEPGHPSPPRCPAPDEHATLRELQDELGLGELLSLARLGTQKLSWDVWWELSARLPEPVGLAELASALPAVSRADLLATLATLRRRGIVLELPDAAGQPRFTLAEPVAELSARELGDTSQHVKRAANMLFSKVFPSLERHTEGCHLTSALAHVPLDQALLLSSKLRAHLDACFLEHSQEQGKVEVRIVLAVDVHQPDMVT